MKSTVENVSPTRAKLTVEVGFDELKPNFDKTYQALGRQVNIPGFRRGKAPARILDARLGRGTVLTEVVNDAVPAKYTEAIQTEQLNVLGQPEIEISKIDDGDVLEFTAEVDIRPAIDVPELDEITVTVDDLAVSEEDVDEQVDALRDRFATTTTVDRPAEDGDQVTLNIRVSLDGRQLDDGSADGLTYTIGSGELVEGMDEAVTGLSAGESATFASPLGVGDEVGKDADVDVTVTAVAERTLPEVDDDFAQMASEFDTVAEMRDDLREKVERSKNLERASDARDKVLQELLERVEIPIPEGAKNAEVEARRHDALHTFDHDEEALAAHLESIGQSREELDKDIDTSAEEAVRSQLLLDVLAEKAEVDVSQEEFTERVIYNAQRFGVSPQEYFQRVQEAGQLGGVFSEIRRGKALMWAVQQATIKDLSGETLDFATLFGIEAIEDDDAEDDDTGNDDTGVGEGSR